MFIHLGEGSKTLQVRETHLFQPSLQLAELHPMRPRQLLRSCVNGAPHVRSPGGVRWKSQIFGIQHK